MAITNLTNTKWYFKEPLDHCGISNQAESWGDGISYNSRFSINFTSNNTQYTSLSYVLGTTSDTPFVDYDDGTRVYMFTTWEDEVYRTITITGGEDVTDPDCITWITSNAIQLEIPEDPDDNPEDPGSDDGGDGGNPLVDLTNTSWYFNETIDSSLCTNLEYPPAGYNGGFSINFVSNETNFDYLGADIGNGMSDSLWYNHDSVDEGVYDYADNTWYDESYRTITITGGDDVINPDLITWITSNARQINNNVGPDPGGDPDLPSDTPDEDRTPTFTFDLSTLNLAVGTYTIYATLSAEGYRDSEPSNVVDYTAVGDLPQLEPATIVLDGDLLKVYDPSGIATSANIYANGEVVYVAEVADHPEDYLNHSGTIPKDAWLVYFTSSGSRNELKTGHSFLSDKNLYANEPGATYYYNGSIYNYTDNAWSYGGVAPEAPQNVIILESIDEIPVSILSRLCWYPGISEPVSSVRIPTSIVKICSAAMEHCEALNRIAYTGTMEQWNAINFEDGWNHNCTAIIVNCTDGVITIPAYES